MKAKFINEDLKDIFKPKYQKEDLDKLSIKELITLVEDQQLVTVEGYGGENKLGFIPNYVETRLYKEGEELENSEHIYNTWDHYKLFKIPKLNFPYCIMKIYNTKTRGGSITLKIVKYKILTLIEHRVDFSK